MSSLVSFWPVGISLDPSRKGASIRETKCKEGPELTVSVFVALHALDDLSSGGGLCGPYTASQRGGVGEGSELEARWEAEHVG